MSKKLLALVAVAGLAIAGYAAAASSGVLPDSVDLGLGANAKCNAGLPDSAAEQAVEQRVRLCAEKGKPMGLPGFKVDGDSVKGRWVSFTTDAAAGQLLDFTSRGPFADTVIFDSITAGALGQEKAVARGGMWGAKDGDLKVVVFDAPNAFLGLRYTGNETATVTFVVAQGIALSALPDNASGPDAKGVLLSKDGHEAALRLGKNATYTLDGQTIVVTLAKGDGLAFHLRGYPGLLAHEHRALHHLAEKREDRREAMREHREDRREARGHRGPPPPDAPEDPQGADANASADAQVSVLDA